MGQQRPGATPAEAARRWSSGDGENGDIQIVVTYLSTRHEYIARVFGDVVTRLVAERLDWSQRSNKSEKDYVEEG